MASGLPPPPTKAASGDFAWTAWYNQLYTLLSTTGSVSWSLINKAGSSIADLAFKDHSLLTNVLGGGQYHMSSTEYTGTGTGNFVRLSSPALTGVPTAPTAAVDTNTTQLATTAYVVGNGYLKSALAASTYFPLAGGTITGNTTFSGTGLRILGDMSNGTLTNRLMFQTSTANSSTSVSTIPNGTNTQADFFAYNASDPTNASIAILRASTSEIRIASAISGTGTYLPMTFYNGGSEGMRMDINRNIYGTSGTTTMTDGFFYIPAAAGAPTGAATAIAGRVPMYYDTTNNNFYVYNGAWKKVLLA